MKRRILVALSVMIAALAIGSLSSPVEVYAISSNNGGGGGGSAHASSDYRAWSRWHQGYRFYMINKDLERVSPVYDFNYQTPTGVSTKYFETRFDTANSPKDFNVNTFDYLQSKAKMDCKPPVAVYDNKGRGGGI